MIGLVWLLNMLLHLINLLFSVDVPQKINNPNYQDIQIDPIELSIRDKIGVIWDGLAPIENIIENSLEKKK